MTRFTKFVHFILRYITFECHQEETLYIQHHMAWRSCNLHLWFEFLIQVDEDVLYLLLVEEECTTKQPRHLENINDMQSQ